MNFNLAPPSMFMHEKDLHDNQEDLEREGYREKLEEETLEERLLRKIMEAKSEYQ